MNGSPSVFRIVFMGTPDFAVASLRALVESGHQVVAVVTAEDKPAGRGQRLHASPVKAYAVSQGIPVLQPARLKDPQFIAELAAYQADLFVVVAFRMLPEVVWRMPRCGTLNVHGSLLPQYRGAAPIHWAIMNGDRETGVTTFFIDATIDTGWIIDQRTVPIADDDCVGTLHDKLMVAGASLLLDTVSEIQSGTAQPHPQPSCDVLRPAPKLFRDTCRIDWTRPVMQLYNQIRGLSPYPAAWTMLVSPQGESCPLKIYAARPVLQAHDCAPGTWLPTGETVRIYAPDGYLDISELQLAGRKRMPVSDFLRGIPDAAAYRISASEA